MTAAQPDQTPTERILDEILIERASHAECGYDLAHDRDHGGVTHLVAQAGNYVMPHRLKDRAGLVKCASLIVAAIELLDAEGGDPR